MVESMLACKNPRLTEKIAESRFMNTACDHFAAYPNNNIYGNMFTNICKGIMNSKNENLVKCFFNEGSFINKLFEITKETTFKNHKNTQLRKINMGQVIAILRELKKTEAEHAVKLRDDHSKWNEINETFLDAEIKRQDDQDFGNTKQPINDPFLPEKPDPVRLINPNDPHSANQEFDDWLEGIFGENKKPSGDDDDIASYENSKGSEEIDEDQ